MNSFAIICYLFDITSNVFYLILIISFEIFYLEILVYLFTFHLFNKESYTADTQRYRRLYVHKKQSKAISVVWTWEKLFLKNITCSMQRKQFLLNLAREIPVLEFWYYSDSKLRRSRLVKEFRISTFTSNRKNAIK